MKEFDKVIDLVVRIRKKFHLHDTKIITITNATGLHRETVRKGIGKMQLKDEIWAKLDAGSSEYFKIISGSRTAFSRVLNNVLTLSREKAVKIQTCFMNINGKPPSNADLLDYCSAVNNIVSAGGSIDQIQLYTPTRPAMNSLVTPLSGYQDLEDFVNSGYE